MIHAISMLGNPEVNVSKVAENKPAEMPAQNIEPAQDTFVPSAPKAEEAPQADPNDKFVKAEEQKPEETK